MIFIFLLLSLMLFFSLLKHSLLSIVIYFYIIFFLKKYREKFVEKKTILFFSGLFCSVVLIIATTRYTTIKPANFLFLYFTIVLLIIYFFKIKQTAYFNFIILLAIVFSLSNIYLKAGVPLTHDFQIWHLPAIASLKDQLTFFTEWIPNIKMGLPLYRFYPPIPHHIIATFSKLLHISPLFAFKLWVFMMNFLTALAVYFFLKKFLNISSQFAIIGVIAYLFHGYYLLDINYRGAINEFSLYPLIPPLFMLFHHSIQGKGYPWLAIFTGFAIFIITLVHIPGFLIIAGFLFFYGIFLLFSKKISFKALSTMSISFLSLFLLFWYKPLSEFSYINIEYLYVYSPKYHGLSPFQCTDRVLWDQLRISDADVTETEMPFYVGISIIWLATLAILRMDRDSYPFFFSFLAVFILITPLGSLIFSLFPFTKWLQFPWRILLLSPFLSSILIARTAEFFHKNFYLIIMAMLILIDLFPYTGAAGWVDNIDYEKIGHRSAVKWLNEFKFVPVVDLVYNKRLRNLANWAEGNNIWSVLMPFFFTEYTTKDFERINNFLKIEHAYYKMLWNYFGIGYIIAPRFQYQWLAKLGLRKVAVFKEVTIWNNPQAKPVAALINNPHSIYEKGKAAEIKFLPNKIVVSFDNENYKYLLIRQMWYPAWRAYLEGKELQVEKNKYGFIYVRVPPGSHEIEFVFQKRWIIWR